MQAGCLGSCPRIECPLIIKKASDLMSKYVGETKQNMAAMFREAEQEKTVLLLDEADSFLQRRALAQRSYEVSLRRNTR